MGRQYAALDKPLTEWIGAQPLFFVATAPTDTAGHVNLSPKGGPDLFRVLGPTTVAYLDLTGSGIETLAHLQDNGRIVLMWCAFQGSPKIVRLHGRGRAVRPGAAEFDALLAHFTPSEDVLLTLRSVVVVDVTRITDSCGYMVPRMDFVAERDQLFRWAEHQRDKQGDGFLEKYQHAANAASIDGLAGLALPESRMNAEPAGAARRRRPATPG